MQMNLALCANPGFRGDQPGRDDAGHPLNAHQNCKHLVSAFENGLLLFIKYIFGALQVRIRRPGCLSHLSHSFSSSLRWESLFIKEHPKTKVSRYSGFCRLSNEVMASRPVLSPEDRKSKRLNSSHTD